MYFSDLYTGTPLQTASTAQRGVSLKNLCSFSQPKGEGKAASTHNTPFEEDFPYLHTSLHKGRDEEARRSETNNLAPHAKFHFKVI